VFAPAEAPADWPEAAPTRVERTLHVAAPPAALFAVLADHGRWPEWFAGMRKVRVEGPAAGVGALRSVWVGASHVRERFDLWEPSRRLRFTVVACNVPGLAAMVEDWQLAEEDEGCRLRIAIGAAGAGPLRLAPGLVRQVVARSTKGAAGIVGRFPATGGG